RAFVSGSEQFSVTAPAPGTKRKTTAAATAAAERKPANRFISQLLSILTSVVLDLDPLKGAARPSARTIGGRLLGYGAAFPVFGEFKPLRVVSGRRRGERSTTAACSPSRAESSS